MSKDPSVYLQEWQSRVNPIFLRGLWAHLPICAGIGIYMEVPLLPILILGLLILGFPTWLARTQKHPTLIAICIGVASMGISGLLIHAMRGMIEAHFHVFILLALLLVFGTIEVILAAAGTIAIHHIAGWLWFPDSVFNDSAGFEIVLIHAVFVVLQALPSIKIASWFKSFIVARGCMRDLMYQAASQLETGVHQASNHCLNLTDHTNEQSEAVIAIHECYQSIQLHLSQTDSICTRALQTEREARQWIEKGLSSLTALKDMQSLNQKFQDKTQDSLKRNLETLKDLRAAFEEVQQCTAEVAEIADQSRLLSVNARIEAARAGKQGKGFSVVADSMGELAEQSMAISRSIQTRIQSSYQVLESISRIASEELKQTHKNCEEMDQNMGRLSSECSAVFSQVIECLSQMGTQVQEVSHSSGQQIQEMNLFTQSVESVLDLNKVSREHVEDVSLIVSDVKTEVLSLNENIQILTSSDLLHTA